MGTLVVLPYNVLDLGRALRCEFGCADEGVSLPLGEGRVFLLEFEQFIVRRNATIGYNREFRQYVKCVGLATY